MLSRLFSRKPQAPAPAHGVVRVSRIAPRLDKTAVEAPADAAEAADAGKLFGGLRFSAREIDTTQALSRVVFDRVINDAIKLSPQLYSRIAVVQVGGNVKTCLLFVDRNKVSGDDVVAVVELLRNQNYQLLPNTGEAFQGYFASSSLVIALSQGHINSDGLRAEREIGRDPTKNALMSTLIDLVSWAYISKADDIDFAVDLTSDTSQVCFKIGGVYVRPDRWLVPTDTLVQVLGIAWQKSNGGSGSHFQTNIEQQARLDMELPRSGRLPEGARVRLRWSGMANDKGTVVTMRIQRLGSSALIRSLNDAGYFPSQMDIFNRTIVSRGGLTVFSGEVGSGKSTSLAALMVMLPKDLKKISVEDPVELDIAYVYQKTVTRDLTSVGPDPVFASVSRAIYRSALDCLLLGEIRDNVTGMLAREVAQSGHSVYTSIHAGSALGTIDRLASPAIGIPRDVLAAPDFLRLLVFQVLLPVTCPHCGKSPNDFAHHEGLHGEALAEHQRYFDRIERLYRIDSAGLRLRDPAGCKHCFKPDLPELNGFNGRTVAAEMVEIDETMQTLILAGKSVELRRYWRSLASPNLADGNLTGRTTMECAISKANLGHVDPREIERRFESFKTAEVKRSQALATRREQTV